MNENLTQGLPGDLAAILRDQSVVVPQDAVVFEAMVNWPSAPSSTASADLLVERETAERPEIYANPSPATTCGVG